MFFFFFQVFFAFPGATQIVCARHRPCKRAFLFVLPVGPKTHLRLCTFFVPEYQLICYYTCGRAHTYIYIYMYTYVEVVARSFIPRDDYRGEYIIIGATGQPHYFRPTLVFAYVYICTYTHMHIYIYMQLQLCTYVAARL